MKENPLAYLAEIPSFNYAVIAAIVNLDVETPSVLVIDYKEKEDSKIEIKLPGGKFRIEDLSLSVDLFLKTNYFSELFYFKRESECAWDNFLKLLNGADGRESNPLFNNVTKKILEMFKKASRDIDCSRIIIESKFNTLYHELEEEIFIKKADIGDFHIFHRSLAPVDHYRLGFVSVNTTQLPIEAIGSSDCKVLRSYWLNIEEALPVLKNGHKIILESALSKIVDLEMHPEAQKLKKFLTARN